MAGSNPAQGVGAALRGDGRRLRSRERMGGRVGAEPRGDLGIELAERVPLGDPDPTSPRSSTMVSAAPAASAAGSAVSTARRTGKLMTVAMPRLRVHPASGGKQLDVEHIQPRCALDAPRPR